MSGFIDQTSTHASNFSGQSSWVILTKIESRIKSKIESMGTPLRDWDIQINYGIKTGYNEAFTIDGSKRNELIKLDPRAAELIQPILRGRDIKRYSYDYADLWLIATFPSLNINIDDYPSIKQHLLSFDYNRLKQTGELGARKKTNYQWFETQDSISYWDDFSKQKIIYPEITKFLNFYLDEQKFFVNNKCFIMTGENLNYLTSFLNSSLFKYCFKDNFPELLGGSRELRKIFLEKIPIIKVDKETDLILKELLDKIQLLKSTNSDTSSIEKKIDSVIFDIYSLSLEERNAINFIVIQ